MQKENDLILIGKQIIEDEINGLKDLKEAIDSNFCTIIKKIIHINGRLILSGIGKSGYVARKISSTLSSTGTPSFFIHPAEAGHGDLGMITKNDVVVLLSNSGDTYELNTNSIMDMEYNTLYIVDTVNDSSVLKHIIHESLNPSQQASSGINTNVRNKVLKQLDSDTETVMLYKSGEKYQDVYSNTTEVNKNTKNNKNDAKPRDKFFNNYLNI